MSVRFPSESDFNCDGEKFLRTVKEFAKTLESLNEMNPNAFPQKTMTFIEKTIPGIWRKIKSTQNMNKNLLKEVNIVAAQLCFLTKRLNLNPKLVTALLSSFEENVKNVKIYPLKELSKEEMENGGFDGQHLLREDERKGDSFVLSLIETIISSGLFLKVVEKCQDSTMTLAILAPICQLFTAIQSKVHESIVAYILRPLVSCTLNLLKAHGSDFHNLCQFLFCYIPMVPELRDATLTFFCSLLEQKGPLMTRHAVLGYIVQLSMNCGVGEVGTTIRKTVIDLVRSSPHASLMKQALQFLPVLSKYTEFSDEDIWNILTAKQTGDDMQVCHSVVEIIKKTSRNLNDFTKKILASDLFNPELYCILMEKVDSSELSEELFNRLLQSPERVAKFSLSSLIVNSKLQQHIEQRLEESKDAESLLALSFFFLNAPNIPSLDRFIMRVIDMSRDNPVLFDVLEDMDRILDACDSERILMSVFDIIYQNLIDKTADEYANALTDTFCKWIDSCSTVPSTAILDKLKGMNFVNCSSRLPELIRRLLDKCNDRSKARHFLLKVLRDTVPQKNAKWLIDTVFEYVRTSKTTERDVVEVLISSLGDETKFANAVYLIYEAVKYEADFYRLSDYFAYIQKIHIIHEQVEIDEFCSLHPLHSTRRLYAFVANVLHVAIEDIELTLLAGEESKVIPVIGPLETIELKPGENLVIQVKTRAIPDGISQEVEPMFMTALSQTPRLTQIFQHMSDTKDIIFDVLFLILSIFAPVKTEASGNLQRLIIGEKVSPLEFSDSIRVFPFALHNLATCDQRLTEQEIHSILQIVATHNYDVVSMSMICRALPRISPDCLFNTSELRTLLLESNCGNFRRAVASLVAPETPEKHLLSLLGVACEQRYRTRTREFFECVKKKSFEPEVFEQFYIDLEQHEMTHYSDPDETFISLLSLIPAKEELIKITLNRLFMPPTCQNVHTPFVHTAESWGAALEYMNKPLVIPLLQDWLDRLPVIPSSNRKLSDDFTYVGRNGIQNLGSTCYINALVQILNSLDCISSKLLARETTSLSPFCQQLRDLLGRLRFTRGQVLSIQRLVETIPNVKVSEQEDAEEFFNIIVNRLDGELENASDITGHLRGRQTTYIMSDGIELSSRSEDFFYLSVPTKGCYDIRSAFRAYFEEEVIEDGYLREGSSSPVHASRKLAITGWPDFLVIQLQRWEFNMETGERNKLVHEFGFPICLEASDIQPMPEGSGHYEYELVGVVIHQGTAEQGHYMSVVQGDDNEWYLCNDQTIEYFDVSQLGNWAFGIPDDANGTVEDACTGYLLFYRLSTLPRVEFHVAPDLEIELNRENEANWLYTVFRSYHMINFAKDLMMSNLDDPKAVQMGLTVFFRVILVEDAPKKDSDVDQEPLLLEWEDLLVRKVLITRERCLDFFKFLDDHVGDHLGSVVCLSDKITNSLTNIITHAFDKIGKEPVEQLNILLSHFGNVVHKRQVMMMMCDLIAETFRDMDMTRWATMEDILMKMIDYVTVPLSKEISRQIKQLNACINGILKALAAIVETNGCDDMILEVFEVERFSRLCGLCRKNPLFTRFLRLVNASRPDIFQDLTAEETIKESLMHILPGLTPPEADGFTSLNLDFLWPNVTKMLFSTNAFLRQGCREIFISMLSRKDDTREESACSIYLTSLVPILEENVRNGQTDICVEYLDLLHRLAKCCPRTLTIELQTLLQILSVLQDANNEQCSTLLDILVCLIKCDPTIKNDISTEQLQKILSCSFASASTILLISEFKESANRSPLFGACIKGYLSGEDENLDIALSLINGGIIPGPFDVPQSPLSIMKLGLANALWNVLPDCHEKLAIGMIGALRNAKPFALFMKNPVVKDTWDILQAYCPNDLQEFQSGQSETIQL